MSATLFRDVEVRDRIVDVRYRHGIVTDIGNDLVAHDEDVVDGCGGALLPGLHDHHIHLLALSALRSSVDCSHGLASLSDAPGGGWIRGVGAVESVDRRVLDQIVPHRPVRVQHATGGLWMLNSMALTVVINAIADAPGVERDERGEPTGRLWRMDTQLREILPRADTGDVLADVVDELLALGITSVTDATPDLDPTGAKLLSELALSVTALGDPSSEAPEKVVIHDHALPSLPELKRRILQARQRNHAVAVHAVTRESLLLALAALDEVGRIPGDRIEHGAVIPDPLKLAGLCVVTQPGFIHERGDRYLADVDPRDHRALYRYQTLLDDGVRVLPSSDAPYGPSDPWLVMRSAVDRRSSSGRLIAGNERVAASTVLAGYTCDAFGRPRAISKGVRTPVLLLGVPLDRGLTELEPAHVRGAWGATTS